MDQWHRAALDQLKKQQRGAEIIDGSHEEFRQDSYSNMLNKYGTAQDNSTAYEYGFEPMVDDMELTGLYEGNGLFAKIIDRPAEEAVKHGFDISYGDQDITEYVEDRMDQLDLEDKFATAEKWARLYGGAIIVMLVDDGRGLDEPLDWRNVRSIEELRVFERSIVQPDYMSVNQFHFGDSIRKGQSFGEPEYYHVFSIYGYFTVHRSRCLVFRNGRLPERTSNEIYRYWGIPEYVRMKRELRECITSHGNGGKLLERCVQGIYKMHNLSNMLSTENGEDKVLRRLQVIDMARNLLNSIAIDNDGEEYTFESFAMSGVKDVLDATCNMLSAVTNIPQTILFGRSPAGMNATGENDLENYYNMVENIQKQNMKSNSRTVIDLILRQGKLEGKIPEIPKYKVRFASLWSMSETEQAAVEKTKAETEHIKAQTAQIYMDSSVLDPSEVRKSLANEGDFDIEEVISADDLDIPEDAFELEVDTPFHIEDLSEADKTASSPEDTRITISGVDAEEDNADHTVIRINMDGGAGSGNFGHSGRPGKVGGSAEGSGDTVSAKCGKIIARQTEIQEEIQKYYQEMMSSGNISQELFGKIQKLNEENSSLAAELEKADPNSHTNVSRRLSDEGHPTKEQIIESIPEDWRNKYSESYEQSLESAFSANIGSWCGEGYQEMKDDYAIAKAIELSDAKWSGGDLYRGMSVSEETVSGMQVGGTLTMRGLSSWSSDISPAMSFATTEASPVLLVDKTKGIHNALSIAQMSSRSWERELIYGKNQSFVIKSIESREVEHGTSSSGNAGDFSKTTTRKVTVIEVEAI